MQLLREGTLSEPQRTHALEVVERNVQNQSRLVEDLIDVSRMVTGNIALQTETLQLGPLVESTVESLALAARAKSISVSLNIEPSLPPVLGDPARLRQTVSNLLVNAIKFTPKGGSVQVDLSAVGSNLRLQVSDSGQGINADFLPHVFDPFRQEDGAMNRRTQGLGLGLSIVKRIVELHGGTIRARSEGAGTGSTFTIDLPAAPPTPRSAAAAPGEPASLTGLQVLIVEDDDDARELLMFLLQRAGATVLAAHDTPSASALLDSHPSTNLIISDIGLPGIDGLQWISELRARAAPLRVSIPAIALSAYTRPVDKEHSLEAGFQAHVSKPVDQAELMHAITVVLRASA